MCSHDFGRGCGHLGLDCLLPSRHGGRLPPVLEDALLHLHLILSIRSDSLRSAHALREGNLPSPPEGRNSKEFMSIFPNHRLGSLFCPLAQLPPVCFLRAAPFVAILFTRPHGNVPFLPLYCSVVILVRFLEVLPMQVHSVMSTQGLSLSLFFCKEVAEQFHHPPKMAPYPFVINLPPASPQDDY